MVWKLLAGLTVAACVVMLLRLVVGWRTRQRFDALMRRWGRAVRRSAQGLRRSVLHAWHWRSSQKNAAKIAEEAIRRARGRGVQRDGNVYKPKSFRGPRKPH